MRLGIKILNSDATINSFKQLPMLKIAQGETVNLVFQLVDIDQNLRFIPSPGSTVQVSVPRNPLAIPDPTFITNRITVDYSINRAAVQLFSQDASIWMIPLAATDTKNMTSSNINVTVNDGSSVKIATFTQAIKIINNQDQ